ncbi:MAG: hypothetical protein NXI04_18350 [Planctomycetaceae bacterium]|nr:hypothetical protein [Planctomycetaceae bacterium]
MNRDGHSFAVPRHRRLSWDLLHYNHRVPLCAHDRQMDLSDLARVRSECANRVSWPALFMKAWALVAAEIPEFRQIWYRWPVAHIYQHPVSVGVLTVSREYRDATWLFWKLIKAPDQLPLLEIQKSINQAVNDPPKRVFRNQVRLASLATFLRRLCWSWNLGVAHKRRPERLGTFFLSTLSGKGAEIQLPPSIQTTCLTYGPISESGTCRVTVGYDHRLFDGALAAEGLARLENVLLETLLAELLHENS